MKMEEIRKIYSEVKELDEHIKRNNEYINKYNCANDRLDVFMKKLKSRILVLFDKTYLDEYISNYSFLQSEIDILEQTINKYKIKRLGLVKKLKENNLPVNGELASADGIVETIYAMKKVK
jgi:CHASE3 domain sensor protein